MKRRQILNFKTTIAFLLKCNKNSENMINIGFVFLNEFNESILLKIRSVIDELK